MIDIQILRDNPDYVKEKTTQKGYTVDIDRLLQLDTERRDLLQTVEVLRQERNQIADSMKQSAGSPGQSLIERGRELKVEIAKRESYLETVSSEWNELLGQIPNPASDDSPIGGEDLSVEVSQFGGQPTGAKDHLDYLNERGWVDFERGAKVAGAKFYFLKDEAALLENALLQYSLQFIIGKGFSFMTVPHMVNTRTAYGAGFAPRSSEESNEYFIEGEEMTMIGTAEAPLTGYHADEILQESQLPLFYAGYSPCYRKEAGTYGKHSRGLFRVHQFNKLEMYAFTLPEQSPEIHEKIRTIEEELWQSIGIPYHVINIASGDLGAPAYKKYDIEYWSKVDGAYRELTSCSNCTDFQARNLNIRVRRADGTVDIVHTLNGTAASMARSLIAVIEHYQNDDGTLTIPEVLRPYMGGLERI